MGQIVVIIAPMQLLSHEFHFFHQIACYFISVCRGERIVLQVPQIVLYTVRPTIRERFLPLPATPPVGINSMIVVTQSPIRGGGVRHARPKSWGGGAESDRLFISFCHC